MSAFCPKRASFTCKSVYYGRDLLSSGLIWRVGNGAKIVVWQDNWISRPSLMRPLAHRPDREVEKVAELVVLPDPGRSGWKL
jgi:hypothetical protein